MLFEVVSFCARDTAAACHCETARLVANKPQTRDLKSELYRAGTRIESGQLGMGRAGDLR